MTSPTKESVLAMAGECCGGNAASVLFHFDADELLAFYNRVREEAIREAAERADPVHVEHPLAKLTAAGIRLGILSLLTKDKTP